MVVENLAVGLGVGRRLWDEKGAVDERIGDDVADTCSTIIAEEIVGIIAIFGQIVGFEEDEKILTFLEREPEDLLVDAAPLDAIVHHKTGVRLTRKTIVETTKRKFKIEMGGVEIESAVVVDDIDTLDAVADANGRVAERGEKFVARAAGDNANESRAIERGELLGTQREARDECADEEGKEKTFHDCNLKSKKLRSVEKKGRITDEEISQ